MTTGVDAPRRCTLVFRGVTATGLVILLVNAATLGPLDRFGRVKGRDFLQFYVAGRMVNAGEAARLYHADRFLAEQSRVVPVSEKNPRYYALYPPTVAALFAPLARLAYPHAIVGWWLVQGLCFAAALALLLRWVPVSDTWRRPALFAMTAFYPVASSVLNGQLTPLLLLALVGGVNFDLRHRPVAAGLAYSLFALKPQFLVGLVAWKLITRQWRCLAAIAIGVVVPVGLSTAILGWEVWLSYAGALGFIAQLGALYRFSPDYQHAVAGMVTNGLGPEFVTAARVVHGVLGVAVLGLLWRACRNRGRFKVTLDTPPAHEVESRDVAMAVAVLAVLLFSPHLLLYDLALLLVPMALLWRAEACGACPQGRRLAALLYASAGFAFIYEITRVSLVPLAMLYVAARGAFPSPAASVAVTESESR